MPKSTEKKHTDGLTLIIEKLTKIIMANMELTNEHLLCNLLGLTIY